MLLSVYLVHISAWMYSVAPYGEINSVQMQKKWLHIFESTKSCSPGKCSQLCSF